MFNLIKKDLIIQKFQLLIFFPFVLFFIFFGNHLPVFLILLVTCLFIPINGYTYDEKAETNILLNSLPYTRKEIIAAKYIGSAMYMIVTIGLTSIIFYVFNQPYTIRDIAIAAGLFLVFAAFVFPLFYILKPGYIGLAVTIGFVVVVLISDPIIRFLGKHLNTITDFITSFSTATLYLSGAGIAISLYVISWIVSQSIYERKAF